MKPFCLFTSTYLLTMQWPWENSPGTPGGKIACKCKLFFDPARRVTPPPCKEALMTFELIVSVHPYCAHNLCRNVTPLHASSTRGRETVLQNIGLVAVPLSWKWLFLTFQKSPRWLIPLIFRKYILYSFFSFSTQKVANLRLSRLGMTSNFSSNIFIFYQMKWHQLQIFT